MKNNLTEIVFVIDKSGSMNGMEDDTVGGFNSMLEKQKSNEGDAYVSTVLFNHYSRVLHDRIPIAEVEPITRDHYSVSGCTALLDALGDAISHIENIHKYARAEDVPEHTVFVITTDGMENSSRRYSFAEIKKKIEEKQKKNGWKFIFLAANIDAAESARNIGIDEELSAQYDHTGDGVKDSYIMMCEAISDVRASKDPSGGGWRDAKRRREK